MKRLTAAVLGCMLAAAATAAPTEAPKWIADLPARDASGAADARTRGLQEQAWAMVGREDRIAPARDKPACAVADVDPVEAIARAAAQAQIVIINEAHDSPRDRAFIADLGVALADVGYKTYAAEAFMAQPRKEGPPRLDSGWYTQEPVFGALLRAMKREGFTFVAYDEVTPAVAGADFVDEINRREARQASNLVNRVFLPNRDAKVLIHVGYRHNDETPQVFPRQRLRQREVIWLARRLKDILGIDPLTIDQTTFAAAKPGLCVSGPDGALPPGRDLYVAHPALEFDRKRPTWRDDTGARVTEVPRRLKRADERVIVEARSADEPADAVPADRVLIDPGEDVPLLLAPGRYKVRAWREDGTVSQDLPLIVRQPPRRPPLSPVRLEQGPEQ